MLLPVCKLVCLGGFIISAVISGDVNYPRGSATAELNYRLKRPKLLAQGLNVLYHRFRTRLQDGPSGIDVIEEDWDNLLILDACRYDTFEQAYRERDSLKGDLRRVRSQAPYTNEFLSRNFGGRKLHDTVYVTSSPHVHKSNRGEVGEIDDDFHAIYHVWRQDFHPETLTDAAIDAVAAFPNKRLVFHYIPPHWPFFGSKGKELFGDCDYEAPWEELTSGEESVPLADLQAAYRENLNIALDHVERLLPKLKGKTVITADHGQLLGDREYPIPVRGYGHPGLRVAELVEVPWLELPVERRRRIRSEPPETTDQTIDNEQSVKALKDLGYV